MLATIHPTAATQPASGAPPKPSASWPASSGNATNELPDPVVFVEEILPSLQSVSVRVMAAATGLTIGYCSLVRRGSRTPHPMHGNNLRAAVLPAEDRGDRRVGSENP